MDPIVPDFMCMCMNMWRKTCAGAYIWIIMFDRFGSNAAGPAGLAGPAAPGQPSRAGPGWAGRAGPQACFRITTACKLHQHMEKIANENRKVKYGEISAGPSPEDPPNRFT